MKCGVKFLASLTALYLFGEVGSWVAQSKRIATTALEKQTRSATRSATIPPGAQVDVQERDLERGRSGAVGTDSQSSSSRMDEPPFLKHPLRFGPNSVKLNADSRNTLKRAAAWLREHREARILIVGYCDASGSETCTPALAEGRGVVVRQFLMRLGIEPDQIAGVKGWDTLGRPCRSEIARCEQFNRSAQIFMASSRAPQK